jgi:ribosome-associated protein
MKIDELLKYLLEQLEEYKITSIDIINISKKSSIADRLVVGTGRSEKHIKAVADQLKLVAKQKNIGINDFSFEDGVDGWLALDFGTILLHLFTETMRQIYQLEHLWTKEIL